MLSLVATKGVAIGVMGVVTLCVGLLPLYIRKRLLYHMHQKSGQVALTGCLCFGAGVLLSIVFLHLLPETQENFRYAMEKGLMGETAYPVAEVIMVCGFFFIYLIEDVIHAWVDYHQKTEEDGDEEVTHHGPNTFEEAKKKGQARRTSVSRLSQALHSTSSNYSNTASISIIVASSKSYDNHGTFPKSYGSHDTTSKANNNNGTHAKSSDNHEAPTKGCDNHGFYGDLQGEPRHNVHTIPHCHHNDEHKHATPGLSLAGTVVVVVALSFHSIMEGMALGLEEQAADVWILLAALCAHKIVISFSMSMELLEVGMSLKPFLVSIFIFSLASPLGGVIGALVVSFTEEETSAGILVPTALQAISGGAILYVTFCEVLERERKKHEGGWVRLLTLVLGFGVMAGLEAIGGHEHGHHSESSSSFTLTTPITLATAGFDT